MNAPELTSQDRAYLRKEGHHRSPLVSIGKMGPSPAITKALEESLLAHELVKVKFHDFTDERRSICETLAAEVSAALVAVVGNTALFYRPALDPAKQTINLPRRKTNHA